MNREASSDITDQSRLLRDVKAYWESHIHDLVVTTHPFGTHQFFQELDTYRFSKLIYLTEFVDSGDNRGKTLLEVGCGLGIDLVRFARAGAVVTGVDLAERAVELAQQNMTLNDLNADLIVMNGEDLKFPDDSFDVVYAHGVLQYTPDAARMIAELHRVLRPGGTAMMMVYNRISWLTLMSKITAVDLEHEDAPVFNTYSIREFRRLLSPFSQYRIMPERFPVPTQLHSGWRSALYNRVFVNGFNLLPRAVVRHFGWHLMAVAIK